MSSQEPTTDHAHERDESRADLRSAVEQCPECGGAVRRSGDEERLCVECGLVLGRDRIDAGAEWRAYTDEEARERSRVGAPTTNRLHDRGLSTVIDWQDRDANGRSLSPGKRAQMHRLRRWDSRFRVTNFQDRNLRHALGEIERMASALELPGDVRETASVVYRRALTEDLVRGRSIEGVATASLFGAMRMTGTPRTADDVARVSRIEKLRFQRTYRQLAQQLELAVAPPEPATYVHRFASELDTTEETERVARDLLRTATAENAHVGRSPIGLAAAAVYAASQLTNDAVTQAAVSEVAEVGRRTIRTRYRELVELRENADATETSHQ